MSSLKSNIDTKKEAFKLVHDPTHLLHLLYTKYGDIEEDYYILIINQFLYNKLSHINAIFKENLYINNIKEFLRRKYNKKETKERIPKLSDYYKNYYKYFCRPVLLNYFSANLLHNYYNSKAEIFYRDNYSITKEKKNDKEKIKNSNSFSSFDNDTDNNIIFDKRNKNIIDNNNENNSISLTFDNSIKNNKELITKRSNNDSSVIFLDNFIKQLVFHKDKKNNKILINKDTNENNKINDNEKINDNLNKKKKEEDKTELLDQIFKKIDLNNEDKYTEEIKLNNNMINNKINNIYEEINKKGCDIFNEINNKKINDKSNNLLEEINKTGSDIFKEINNNNKKLALKLSRNISKLDELNHNKKILNMKQNNLYEISSNESKIKKNKYKINKNSNNKNNDKDSNKNINNENIDKESNKNSHKNILKLKQINKKKSQNEKNIEYRNSSKKDDKEKIKIKDFLTIKSTKIINQKNQIKTFKLIKNPLSNNKKSKDEKKESKKYNTIFNEYTKSKSNKKISISNKLSKELLNQDNIKNPKKNSDNFINYNLNKYNILFRNELGSKKSKTSDKLNNINNINIIYLQNEHKDNKNVKISNKNNLSYFNNEYEQNNLLNSLKLFNSDHSREMRNSDLISKNFIFKNYTTGKILIKKNINTNNKKTGLNNLKNFFYLSRNKNKNVMQTFNCKSIALSVSHSKNGETLNKKFKTFSLKPNSINNKKIFISNLKMQYDNFQKEKIEEILKNSKLISNSLDKQNKNKIFNTINIDLKNGIFSPINLKNNFNFKKDLFNKNK